MIDEVKNLTSVMNKRKQFYNKFLDKSEYYLNKKQYNDAALFCEMAARFASECHAGIFYDYRIEYILHEISKNIFEENGLLKEGIHNTDNQNIKKVLHIATRIHETGGHTRLVLNWIANDRKRVNDLLLTDQDFETLPIELLKTYSESFEIKLLKTLNNNYIDKAKEIRSIALRYDAIILHIHPEDVTAFIALANINIPVLFLNHADHKYWIGRSISNIVIQIRNEGLKTSSLRRNIAINHQTLFPIPLKKPIKKNKATARKNLNIGIDEIVIFSVASPYKYIPLNDNGLKDCILQLTQIFNNIKFIFIGPNTDDDYWREIYKESKGKVAVLGEITVIDDFYLAADIYIDSYPISSLTSLLDAAKYNLPIISVNKNTTTCDIDDLALDNEFKVNTLNELRERIQNLIENEEFRNTQASKYCSQVRRYHLLEGSSNILDELFNTANSIDKINNEKFKDILMPERDHSIVYLHFKNRNRDFEYTKVWAWYYERVPKEEQIYFMENILNQFQNSESDYYALLPYSLKNLSTLHKLD